MTDLPTGDTSINEAGSLETALKIEPVVPSPEVRAEFERFLDADQTALGDVWRRTRAGETPDAIRVARGNERSTFVYSYQRVSRAMVEGDLPTAPTVALQVARRFRSILSSGVMSAPAAEVLRANLVVLEQRAASEAGRQVEDLEALAVTEVAEAEAVLPAALDEDGGDTLDEDEVGARVIAGLS